MIPICHTPHFLIFHTPFRFQRTEMMSKFVGESEGFVRALFSEAEQERQKKTLRSRKSIRDEMGMGCTCTIIIQKKCVGCI